MTQLNENDLLSRFAVEKSYFRPKYGTVRWNAFMPAKYDNNCSVFNIENLDNDEIWDIGTNYVANVRNKPLLARAEILVNEVKEEALDVIPETSVHERHANICAYPEERSEIQLKAIELSNKARLVIKNN